MALMGIRKTAQLYKPSNAAFSPDSIASLLLWWDPSDTATLSLSGSELLTMTDKSGNGYDADTPGTTGPDSGTVTINSLNALEVATAGEYLRATSFPLGDTNHIFWVANVDGVTSTDISMMGFNDGSATNFDWRLRGGSTTSTWNASYRSLGGNTSGSIAESPAANYAGTAHLWELEHNAAADTCTIRVNGSQKAQSAINTQTGSYSGTFNVFANETGASGATGDLGEVLVFNAVLTGDDLTNVRSYLQDKWGTP
jgi:hypothetical protein